MIQNNCWECGSKLIEKELENEGIVPYCPSCKQFRFPMYNVAVSMIVRNAEDKKIMLIKQYNKDRYILVAGYVTRGESIENAVKRELKEETGMTPSMIEFNRTKFFEPSNTLMCNFTVWVENTNDLNVNYEIDSFSWFTPDEAQKEIYPNSLAEEFLNKYLDEDD